MNKLYQIARREQGLTLVEIIVVLILLSILIAFLTKGLFKGASNAKARINLLRMEKVKGSINQYQLMYNTFPSSLEALTSCNEQTGTACIPVATEDDLKDSWDHRFVYVPDGGGRGYTIKTLGADGQDGGSGEDADILLKGP